MAISLPIISTFDNKGVNSAVGAIQGLGSKLVGLGALVAGAFVVREIASFTKESIFAAEAVQQANNRLIAVAKATGVFGAETDKVTKSLIKFAEAQELRIGVDAEVIKGVQAQLLSFKKLSASAGETGGVFERVTQAAFDMAAAGFGSAESNAIALGKAFEDPIRGLTALRRSGTVFTEEQQQLIKTLVQTGDTLGAQEVILKELETQYGGTAAATATASARMALAFDNIKEALGTALLPAFEQFTNYFINDVQPALVAFFENDFPRIVSKASAAFSAVQPVFEEVGAVLKEALGIEAESSLLEGLLDKIAEFEANPEFAANLEAMVNGFNDMLPDLKELVPLLADLAKVVIPFLLDVLPTLIPILTGLVEVLSAGWQNAKKFRDEVSATVEGVPNWVAGLAAFIPGILLVIDHVKFMEDSFIRWRIQVQASLDLLLLSFELWVAAIPMFFETLPQTLYEIGQNIINGLLNGLKAAWSAVEKWVNEKVSWIINAFKRALKIGSPSKVFFEFGENIVQGLVGGLDSLSPTVDVAMDNLAPLPVDGGFASMPGGVVSPMGGANYYITVNAGIGTNGAQVGEQIVNAIKRYERSSGKVFASA